MKNQEIATENDSWFKNLQTEAEKIGARLHLIPKLVVDYTKSYREAVIAGSGGTQTEFNSNVLSIGSKYGLPDENKVIEETIILFSLQECHGYSAFLKVVEWGLSNDLLQTTPHVPFTIGEQKPNLNHEFGENPTWVFETTGAFASSEICYVCWLNNYRSSECDCFDYGGVWFAFRKKIVSSPLPERTTAEFFDGC